MSIQKASNFSLAKRNMDKSLEILRRDLDQPKQLSRIALSDSTSKVSQL